MAKICVGTYCRGGEDSLFVYDLNEDTGALRLEGASGLLDNPSYLAAGSRGQLYAVSETESFQELPGGAVAMLKMTGSDVRLLDIQPTRGGAPCHVAVSSEENAVFVSNYMGGSISVYRVNDDKNVLELLQLVQHSGSGPVLDRQEAAHAHFCACLEDRLYCADLGLDTIKCYLIREGGLAPLPEEDFVLRKGSGVRHFVQSKRYPNRLVAVCELTSEVMLLDRKSPADPLLQAVSTLPEGCGESYCAAIKQSADGTYVLVSNRGHDSIAVLEWTEEGVLRIKDIVGCEGKNPRDFLILERHVVVANQSSDELCVFTLDPESGTLRFTGERAHCPKPVCVIRVD